MVIFGLGKKREKYFVINRGRKYGKTTTRSEKQNTVCQRPQT